MVLICGSSNAPSADMSTGCPPRNRSNGPSSGGSQPAVMLTTSGDADNNMTLRFSPDGLILRLQAWTARPQRHHDLDASPEPRRIPGKVPQMPLVCATRHSLVGVDNFTERTGQSWCARVAGGIRVESQLAPSMKRLSRASLHRARGRETNNFPTCWPPDLLN